MKKILIAMSICAASFAFAQDNTGAAASQQAAVDQPQDKVAESIADLKLGSKILDRFSASVTAGYESAYVFRGIKEAGHSMSPQVDLGYDFGAGFAAYIGYWGSYEVGDSEDAFNESDIYAGVTYTFKNVTFDTGVINYIYPGNGQDEWEWKAAVSYDTVDFLGDFNVCPSIAYFYNNELDASIVEVGLSYSAPVMKWINGDNWLSIDSSVMYGYVNRNGSNAREFSGDYSYIQLKSDLRIAITDYCSYSVGVRYSWASGNGVRGYNNTITGADADESNHVWFGTSISFGF
ncbi:MAG: hypothetical protein J6B07_05790 [Opitutales bacterium]|nr:hypothetical protein [Opitutales bacterium]